MFSQCFKERRKLRTGIVGLSVDSAFIDYFCNSTVAALNLHRRVILVAIVAVCVAAVGVAVSAAASVAVASVASVLAILAVAVVVAIFLL